MNNSIVKRNLVAVLTLIFSMCLALSIVGFIPKTVKAEETTGFAVSERVKLQPCEEGAFLRYETAVEQEWLDANPSTAYTFGTLIFPSKNGSYDPALTLEENEQVLDAVNIVIIDNEPVEKGFIFTPAILFDYERLTNWAISVKPELAEDEEALWAALDNVIEELMFVDFTAVSYAITDGGVVTSNHVASSIANAEHDDGEEEEEELVPPVLEEFVGEEVTEDQFYQAVSFANVNSFSAYGTETAYSYDMNNNVVTQSSESFVKKDGNNWFNSISEEGIKIYFENNDGRYYIYYVIQGQVAQRMETDEETWATFTPEAYYVHSKKDINFNHFHYSDGYYEGRVILPDGEEGRLIYAFVNGEVEYIKVCKYVDGVEVSAEYRIYNRNSTVIKIPTDYVDAGEGGGEPDQPTLPEMTEEEWNNLFKFDNVSVNYSSYTEYPEFIYEGETYPGITEQVNQQIRVAGNEWLISTEKFDGMGYKYVNIYFNGEKSFIDGVEDSSSDYLFTSFMSDVNFSGSFEMFTRRDEVSFITKVPFNGGGYLDGYLTITITAYYGTLERIEYYVEGVVIENDLGYVEGGVYRQSKVYEFYNWGETIFNGSDYGELSEWAKQFDVKNATISVDNYAIIGEDLVDTNISADYLIDNGSWIADINMPYGMMPGNATINFVIYCDQGSYYQNGIVSDERLDNYVYNLLILKQFLTSNASAFEMSEVDGVITYTASYFEDSFAGEIYDVTFTVVDGIIATLSFVVVGDYYDVDKDEYYDMLYVYELTDLNETEIDSEAYFERFKFNRMLNISNATVTITLKGDAGETLLSTAVLELDGYKWTYTLDSNTEDPDLFAWHDGIYYVINDTVYTWAYVPEVGQLEELLYYFSTIEKLFTVTEDGDTIYYVLEDRCGYDGQFMKDITIVAKDGVITQISFVLMEYANEENGGEEYVETLYTYTFSDHGNVFVEYINPDEFIKSDDFIQGGGEGDDKPVVTYQDLFQIKEDNINFTLEYFVGEEFYHVWFNQNPDNITVMINGVDGEGCDVNVLAENWYGDWMLNSEICDYEAVASYFEYFNTTLQKIRTFAKIEDQLVIEYNMMDNGVVAYAEFVEFQGQTLYDFNLEAHGGRLSHISYHIIDETCFDENGDLDLKNAIEVVYNFNM